MDDRTEPNNCTGTKWYSGTRFWYDIIWFGTWYEVIWFGPWFVILVRNFGTILFGSVRGTTFLVRNSVVRFVFGLLVRDFRTGTEWFGSVRIFQKIVFFEPNRLRTDLFGTKSVRSDLSEKYIYFCEPITDRANYVPNKLVRNRFGPKNQFFENYDQVRIS